MLKRCPPDILLFLQRQPHRLILHLGEILGMDNVPNSRLPVQNKGLDIFPVCFYPSPLIKDIVG